MDPAAAPPRLLEHDPAADREGLEALAAWCAGQFSPLVALESLDPQPWAGSARHAPEALLLDVTGIAPLFGGEGALARRVVRLFRRRGLAPRVALAGGVGAAWGLAHYGPFHSAPGVVRPEAEQAAVGRLPVEALRLTADVVERLRRVGIDRIAALWELPRAALPPRFGKRLLERLDQAAGRLEEPLAVFRAPPPDSVAVDLEYPTGDREILQHVVQGLVERLARQLAERCRGALRLACWLEAVDRPPLEIDIGLFTPTADAAHLGRLVAGSLERRGGNAQVHRVTLAATLTGALAQQQTGLLEEDERPAESRQLAQLVDTLSGRLGRGGVLQAVPEPDPQPERAYRTIPLAGRMPAGPLAGRMPAGRGQAIGGAAPRDPLGAHPEDPLRRPLELLPEPQPLGVLAMFPEGPPSRFRLRGRAYRVVRYWGPERIETGWWRGPTVARDYFRVETEEGQWMWLYRTLTEGRWFLHGWFS